MNGIVCWRMKSRVFAVTVVATLLFGLMWSAARSQAAVSASCPAQVDRAEHVLAAGRTVDRSQMSTLQWCVLSQPAQTAKSLELAQAESTTTAGADTSSTVVGSFRVSLPFFCLNFNSDGTIDEQAPSYLDVVSGGYVGTPGVLTVFAFSLGFPGGATIGYVGLTIGPLFVAVPTVAAVPDPELSFLTGLEVSTC